MALVSYSDSEGSDNEQSQTPAPPRKAPTPPPPTAAASKPGFNSIVDRSHPRKIRVNLSEQSEQKDDGQDGERAPKRARTGGGALSGFNAMLPAPKRTAQTATSVTAASKGTPRKVFSLKTGAEPGFDRAADAELRQLFTEQDTERNVPDNSGGADGETEGKKDIPTSIAKSSDVTVKTGNPMMFKPLSVARNGQKKKKANPGSGQNSGGQSAISRTSASQTTVPDLRSDASASPTPAPAPAPKVSLFSMRSENEEPAAPTVSTSHAEYEPLVYSNATNGTMDDSIPALSDQTSQTQSSVPSTQSLQSIASDLNLSASAQRQLFGRSKPNQQAANIIHFDTDTEYAANEVLRASGEAEANQHRGVKAIAPGKHSLKQLISSASGQIEALEDSFAAGKRKKGEAGSRYGW